MSGRAARLRALADAVDLYLEHSTSDAGDADVLADGSPLSSRLEPVLGDPTAVPSGGAAASAAQPAPPGRRFGKYRLVRELGRGGMGSVHEAVQESTGQRVALKILHESVVSPANMVRFEREARTAAQVRSADICRVYDVDEHDGTPYIVMEYVDGEPLDRVLEAERAARRDGVSPGSSNDAERITRMVEIVERCARAVGAVHEAGIVHRDLKPGNVIVRPDGSPVVLDFGLAVDTTDDAMRVTASGVQLGTLPFMAPEQVDGARDIDATVDVYALGVVLYEALTLRLPFEAATREKLCRRILAGAPADPRRFDPRVSRDLAAICLRALRVDSRRRYRNASEMADDLRRVLDGQPTLARPPSTVERVWYRAKLHRWPLLAAALVAIAVSIIAVQRIGRADAVEETAVAMAAFDAVLDSWFTDGQAGPAARETVERYVAGPTLDAIRTDLGGRSDVTGYLAARSRYRREFAQQVTRTLRSDGSRLVGSGPSGGVVESRPTFAFHPLKDPSLRYVLEVETLADVDEPLVATMTAAASDAGEDGRIEVTLPPDVSLAPADYAWLVSVENDTNGLYEPVGGDFTVHDPSLKRRVLAAVRAAGDPDVDATLRAFALLQVGLAAEALVELRGIAADAPRQVQRVRDHLLGWALALGGDLEAARETHERLRGQ